MNFEDARDYLLARPEAYEDYPFGADVTVMKIAKKMFATLVENDGTGSMNLKCDPHEALILPIHKIRILSAYCHWRKLSQQGIISGFALPVIRLRKTSR